MHGKHLHPAVGIIGLGMVGAPLKRYFEEWKGYVREEDLFLFDIDPAKGFEDDMGRADVVFVSVPTPRSLSGEADLSAVRSSFGRIKGSGKIMVIKSTVPPGTTEMFQREFPQHKVLFNPEFLTESRAWEDFVKPDRQIVGFTEGSVDAAHLVLSLLPKAPFMSPWGLGTYRPIKITATEAELIKYGGNVYFARKVAFANTLSSLAEHHGANYENVRLGVSADYRIGDSHLDVHHGGYRGFGGYCLVKDLDAYISALERAGLAGEAALLRSDRIFNTELLLSQGLTPEDVSVHDGEWIRRKLERSRAVPSNALSSSLQEETSEAPHA